MSHSLNYMEVLYLNKASFKENNRSKSEYIAIKLLGTIFYISDEIKLRREWSYLKTFKLTFRFLQLRPEEIFMQ